MNTIAENLEKQAPELYINGEELQNNYTLIKECTHLQALSILGSGEDTFDFSFLQRFKQLRVLDLGYCRLEHCEALAVLEHLEELYLPSNLITDITALQYLSKLKVLNLKYNYVTNLESLRHLRYLEAIDLENNELKTVKTLEHLQNLQVLDLSFNQLTDIALLQNNLILRELYISSTASSQSFAFLEKLTNLTIFYAHGYGNGDIKPLQNLNKLQKLDLGLNQIADITPLENMLDLELLSISMNKIQHIDCLQNMKKMVTLHIDRNQITDMTCLQNLPALTLLDASENQIQTLPTLSAKDLKLLRLNDNQLTHFPMNFLQTLPALQDFELHNNPIENLPKKLYHKGASLRLLREYIANNI